MGKFMDLLLIDNSNIFIEVKNLVGQNGRFLLLRKVMGFGRL